MRGHVWRWCRVFSFLSILFLLATTHVGAQDHQSEAVPGNSYHERDSSAADHNGRTALEEATALLRQMETSRSHLTRFNKPSGMLGTTAHYAKEIFFLLFMNGPPETDITVPQSRIQRLSPPLRNAKRLLEQAAAENSPDAIFLLAEMNFHGNFSHPRNYTEALKRYHDLAALNGNATAQHMLGFMYATGMGGHVKRDQALAMLYHKFAAEGGNTQSQMTTAFRHHSGISTARNCEEAVRHYRSVAEKAINFMRSGPPGGHQFVRESYRLADEVGGVFGEGASVSSAGANAKGGSPSPDDHGTFDNVMEYLDLMSRKGDLKATFSLGKLYYDGSRAVPRDFKGAKEKFLKVARTAWAKGSSNTKGDGIPGTEKLTAKAAGYLGRMFLRGEGMEQSLPYARTWFERGVASGDALSQYSLGIIYLKGYGVQPDPIRAAKYFAPAADQDMASAQVQLGALFLDQGDVPTATKYFELAARHGQIEAFYYLAELSDKGVGRERACGVAAAYYKIVAEKAEAILSPFVEANAAYANGDAEAALVYYMMAAEQGFETGQANVAYLLDQQSGSSGGLSLLSSLLSPFTQGDKSTTSSTIISDAALALLYWTRSAKQSNIDSMVKMGDYYLSGLGTPSPQLPDPEKAAACYSAAAETMQSAQALWNLGWMHENGIGIEQDFHLAKRYYDQALETNLEAYLPVTLALYKLRLRSLWNRLVGGGVRDIQEEPSLEPPMSWQEWLVNFVSYEADVAAYQAAHDAHAGANGAGADGPEPDDWDAAAGGGHYQSHHGVGGGGGGGEVEGGAGAGAGGGDGDILMDVDEGVIESLLIVGLAAALALLVFYRQQRQNAHQQERQQREQQQQQQPQQQPQQAQGTQAAEGQRRDDDEEREDRGMFPRPEDPDFNRWVVGGIGH